MPSKEEEFKQRFVAILRDLQTDGKDDLEAMWLLGSLGAALLDKAEASSWPRLKQELTAAGYDGLLRDFESQGNALYREGKTKQAYAIQTLAVSLVARTQQDDQLRGGEVLLDEMIDKAIALYRASELPPRPN